MGSERESPNTSKLDEPRKTRQQKIRNSPNSRLLSAAWPKAPTVPTRRSQIKTVNHGGFEKSWDQWRQQTSGASSCAELEDMEVDVDVNHTCEDVTKTATTTRRSGLPISPSGNRSTIKSSPVARKIPLTTEEQRVTLKAKRTHNEQSSSSSSSSSGVQDSPSRRSTRGSVKVDKEDTPVEANKNKKDTVEKMKIDRNKENQALFIIIHVSKVELGIVKGPASSPVKVYADKFMVQMEDESTKKEVSFRVPCKNITSLDVSLLKKPFMIKFTTTEIQYLSGGPKPSRKSKGQETETILLHLGYEEHVPEDVRSDLKELFHVRLAELCLWPEKEGMSPTSEGIEVDIANEEKVEEKGEDNNSNNDKKSLKKSEEKDVTKSATEEKEVDVAVKETIKSDDKDPSSIKMISVRKRTPQRSKSDSGASKGGSQLNVSKFPRRCNFEGTESLEEQVKTFSHEAAHYQAAFAQQRMIIQSLEDDMEKRSAESRRQIEELQSEVEAANSSFSSRDVEMSSLHNDLKSERDLVKALEDRIDSMRRELSEKDRTIGDKNVALRVRDETIQQLRTLETLHASEKTKNGEIEATVPLSTMEETRQNLMQMQVSKDNLSVELEQTRINLIQKTNDLDQISTQLNGVRNELRAKDDRLLQLRSDFISSQEELVRKNERIRLLNEQLTESGDNNEEMALLRSELLSSRSEVDDLTAELAEAKSRLDDKDNDLRGGGTNDWTIERGEITFQDGILGVGAWGNVKKGKFRGTDVAVKQIHLLILSPHNRRLFEREMSIASRCRHPCLVQFIGATNDDGTPLFVMELLETDLRTLLSREALKDRDCIQLGFDVIRALTYLHQSKPTPIIHRDISSSNILLYNGSKGWRAKLSDYGAANFMRLAMTRHPGAFLYSAPEASTVDQTTKLDVYSFGVLFCEMCTRELPVPENRREQVDSVTNVDRKLLIKNCLKRDVSKRIDSADVLQVFDGWCAAMVSSTS